jgi:hypothetical protein
MGETSVNATAKAFIAGSMALFLAACRGSAKLPDEAAFGPNPTLSKLSLWWLLLGIDIARIKPGHPQQNGRHERMPRTLKKEATRPPGFNSLQQQGRFELRLH